MVVTHDPGPWFEESLAALAGQTYGALSVLVVDTASAEDPTPRVAAVVPGARVIRLAENVGFAAAANEVLGVVEGAGFYLLCHDDVAPHPDAVRTLVEEAFRSNAGVLGPKLVDWRDPARVRHVGGSVDKTGVPAPLAEPGELDQEQHDAVRDVFYAPGAFLLVRADLFATLGGFDAGVTVHGEDIDLCWRAHVAGARVMVVPPATVRHLEALGERRPTDDRRRLQQRHRVRTLLSVYRPFHLVRVVPQALVLMAVEAVYGIVSGNLGQTRDVVGAWTWNLRHLPAIHRRRKALAAVRTVRDTEVRELQVRGSARLTAFVRGQIGQADERLAGLARTGRDLSTAFKTPLSRVAIGAAVVTIVFMALGSRNLVTRPIPALGDLTAFPEAPGDLLRSYLSGWRSSGAGGEGPSPTGLGAFGLAGTITLGSMGAARKLLLLGMLPVGAIGAWRLARPIGSVRAAAAALVVYGAIPVPYNALASGSWGGLVMYATSPWILLGLARGSRLAPFGRADTVRGSTEAVAALPSKHLGRQIIGLGLLLALAAVVTPFVVAVAGLVALAMVLGSLFVGRPRGSARILGVGAGAAAVAFVLHLPWSVDLVRPGATWATVAGVRSGEGGVSSVGTLLRFQTGPFGAPPLGWAFLVGAALPLLIGRGWRLEWAIRAWFVALAGWAVLWAGQEDWLARPLPQPEVLLAPVAAALSLAAALGMAAFEVDLRHYRFGWRQGASLAAAVAVFAGALTIVPGVVDGRWRVPGGDLNRALAPVLVRDGSAPSRVLWIGDPDVVPAAASRLDDRASYATTAGLPALRERWAPPPSRGTELLGDTVRLAQTRRTNRLGRLLAPYGVRYVVVPVRTTPTAYPGTARPAPPDLAEVLASQLDLQRVDTDRSLIVYRNTAWRGLAARVPEGDADANTASRAATADIEAWGPIITGQAGHDRYRVEIDEAGPVVGALPSDAAWELEVDGTGPGASRAFGWASRWDVTRTGAGTISYATSPVHLALCLVQVLLWVGAFALLSRLRRTTRGPELAEAAAAETADAPPPATGPVDVAAAAAAVSALARRAQAEAVGEPVEGTAAPDAPREDAPQEDGGDRSAATPTPARRGRRRDKTS